MYSICKLNVLYSKTLNVTGTEVLLKISMLTSVNVIYLRIYQNFILISYHKQRRERMYWEGSGKISKLK